MFVGLQPKKEQPYAHTDGSGHPEKGKSTSGFCFRRERSMSLCQKDFQQSEFMSSETLTQLEYSPIIVYKGGFIVLVKW